MLCAARVVARPAKSPAEKIGMSIAKARMAATIWFFVSVEAKVPIDEEVGARCSAIAEVARGRTGPEIHGRLRARRIRT